MRLTALMLIAALGMAASAPAGRRTLAQSYRTLTPDSSNIVQVWGGCGWGFHPTYWGGCVPNPFYVILQTLLETTLLLETILLWRWIPPLLALSILLISNSARPDVATIGHFASRLLATLTT